MNNIRTLVMTVIDRQKVNQIYVFNGNIKINLNFVDTLGILILLHLK